MSAATASRSQDSAVFQRNADQVRRGFAQTLSVLVIALPLFSMVAQAGEGADVWAVTQVASNLLIALTGLVMLILSRGWRILAAGVVGSLVLTVTALFTTDVGARALISVMSLIIVASLTPRLYFYAIFLTLFVAPGYSLLHVIQTEGWTPNEAAVEAIITGGLLLIVSIIVRQLYDVTEYSSDAAEESYRRLAAIAQIGRQTTRVLKLDELLQTSAELIKEQFEFYHVQIFLVDDRREYANLVASTGEAGRRLLSRNHRLAVGSQSVIGRVTLANEHVLINDTELEPDHAYNPLLPDTRAELALPMQVQVSGENRVIGALDVQSIEPDTFSPADVQAIQALANQLGVAIRNAQLFEAQEANLHENERLYAQAQASLEEIQRLNRQLTRQAWDGLIAANPDLSGVRVEGERVTFDAGWTPAMIEACRKRELVTRKEEDADRVTAAPILLRDEILGAVEIIGGGEEELNFIEAVIDFTERFATALENVRLVEEAQANSAQEQHINTVVSRFQEAATVDELLQITLSELAQTLDADTGSIRVGLAPSGQATS